MRRQKPAPSFSSPSAPSSASDTGLRAEHRRLRRTFAALLVAVAPAALAQACVTPTSHESATGTGGGAKRGPDAGGDAEAGLDALGASDGDAAPLDVGADSDCNAVITLYDAGIDVEEGCTFTLPCGLPTGLVPIGCDLYIGGMPFGCSIVPDSGCLSDAYVPDPDGPVAVDCPLCPAGGGRRPRGLRRARPLGAPTPLGAYFARMAHEEAASVHAFRRMRDELAALGAPLPLQRAAERSARDEERHARAMARRARALGAPVAAARVRRWAPRSLEAVARENAVEGCVHETFGALLMAWQASEAPVASLRRTFARIAADEARHAALSWAVARWAEARLDAAARARVDAARTRAAHALRRRRGPSSFDAAAGRPDPARRAALVDGLVRQLGLG